MTPDTDTTHQIEFELGPVTRQRIVIARTALVEAQESLRIASAAYRDAVRAYYAERKATRTTHKAIADDLGISTTSLNDLLRPRRRKTR